MNGGRAPLVSVILCTKDRPESLGKAIDSILAQTFDDFELLVVDDGESSSLVDGIRTIRCEHRGIGDARNAGLCAARGVFTAYCDDDDLWFPHHLSTLVQYLSDHPEVALVYGDSELVCGQGAPSVPYSINYDGTLLADCNYIFASDVLHRTEPARYSGGFSPSLEAFEDWDLWLRMSHDYTLRHIPVVLGSRHWHDGCLSAGDHWDAWREIHQAHQSRLRSRGEAARHGLIVPPVASAGASASRKLAWYSSLRPNEGHGSVGRQLLHALDRQGVEINMAPTRDQPQPGFERFYEPFEDLDRTGFYYHYWVRPSVLSCKRTICYTMWESSRVPADHVEEINRAVRLLYVPCRQNLDSFRENSVRVPIKVLHHGVDPEQFPLLERSRREHFTFGTFGDLSPRKGIDVLVRAFLDEFAPGEPARLVLKSSGPISGSGTWADNDRITWLPGFMPPEALLAFLGQLDVFILPSRGEGFGLCGLEAMATGLPLIATGWSGPAEYLDPIDSFPLAYRLVEAGGTASNHVEYHGLWAEPDYEHLRSLMRWLFDHPEEAAARGQAAAARVRKDWGWDRIARQFCQDLDELIADS